MRQANHSRTGLVPASVTDSMSRILPSTIVPQRVADAAGALVSYVPAPVTDSVAYLASFVPSVRASNTEEEKDALLAALDRAALEDDEENARELQGWADKLRARILYALAPCDKSVWQCTRDPLWVGLTLLGFAPFGVGTAWWLIMFVLHDKQDEFQLCNFIVSFMFSKFLGAIALLVQGSVLYYLCSTRDVPTCQDDGPRVSELYDGILFFAQVLVVWLSYLLLPLSQECRAVLDPSDAYLVEDWDKLRHRDQGKGGRLMALYSYHGLCVFFVMGLAWAAHSVAGQEGWKLRATLYWLKVLFGLLALPFVAFKLPFINTLLMQVRTTGYNPSGRVVLHVRPRPPPPPQSAMAAEKQLREASASLLSSVHVDEPHKDEVT